jgi:hypothetical protein
MKLLSIKMNWAQLRVKLAIVASLLSTVPLSSIAADDNAAATRDWRKSVVNLDVNRKRYDYFQPWVRPVEDIRKVGVVIGPKQILTTA